VDIDIHTEIEICLGASAHHSRQMKDDVCAPQRRVHGVGIGDIEPLES
jgi:hypothetical protein